VKAGRHQHRSRFSIRWAGFDTGGSGLRTFTLQAKRPHGHFRNVAARTHRRAYSFSSRRAGTWAFRVRAVDAAGNVSAWSVRRVLVRR
jgi:ferredoxin-NADP reductase